MFLKLIEKYLLDRGWRIDTTVSSNYDASDDHHLWAASVWTRDEFVDWWEKSDGTHYDRRVELPTAIREQIMYERHGDWNH